MDALESPHSLYRTQHVFWSHPADTLASVWTLALWLGSSLSFVPSHLHSLSTCRERHGTHHAGVHPLAGRTQGPGYAF